MHNHVAQKKSMDAPWRNSWQVALRAIHSGGNSPQEILIRRAVAQAKSMFRHYCVEFYEYQ